MSAKEVSMNFANLHSRMKGAINDLKTRKLSPDHRMAVERAETHLVEADGHHRQALNKEAGGLGSNQMDTDKTHGNLQEASNKLSKAHSLLHGSGVLDAHDKSHMTSGIPSHNEIKEHRNRASGLQRQGAGGRAKATKSYGTLVFGRHNFELDKESGTYKSPTGGEITQDHVEQLAAKFGEAHPGVKKLRAAYGGTRRGDSGQGIAGSKTEAETGGARGNRTGVVRNKSVNPRKPASSRQTRENFSSDTKKLREPKGMMPGLPTKKQSKGK